MVSKWIALLTVTFGLIALFSAANPVLDPDMWWHLAVGEEILSRKTVYFADPFSFTHQAVWVNAQWLTEIIFALVNRSVGIIGLELLTLLLKVVAFLLVFAVMDAPYLTRVWLTLLFAFGAFPVMGGARPQLFSYIFLAAIAFWLHRQRQDKETWRQGDSEKQSHLITFSPFLFVLPFLFALWANLHSFYPVAFALLVLALLADWWNERKGWKPAMSAIQRRQFALALLISVFALLFNPFGWHSPIQVIINIVQSSQLPIEEWKPVTEMRHPMVFIWCGLLLLWVACVAWSPKRMDALEFLWGSFLTVSAFSGVRMIAVWCLVMAPFAAKHLGAWLSSVGTASTKKVAPKGAPITVAVVCVLLALLIVAVKFSPTEFAKRERKEYPQRTVMWMKRQSISGRCLTRYDWSGYVSWRLQRQCSVFVDGRADFYPLSVMRDFITVYSGGSKWRQILNRYGVNIVLLPPNEPLVSLLLLCPNEWQLVYRDRQAVVFVRR